MKRLLYVALIIAMLAVLLPAVGTVVYADDPPTSPGNSTPGADRYNSNPGLAQTIEVGAQGGGGAISGAYGYIGKDNSMGAEKVHCESCGSYPGPGTIGYITGLNNAGVVGNRQGNLPP